LAEDALGALQAASFHEALVVSDEDVADVLRIVDEEHLLAAHPVRDDAPIGAREVFEEGDRIAARQVDQRAENRLLRAGDGYGRRQGTSVLRVPFGVQGSRGSGSVLV